MSGAAHGILKLNNPFTCSSTAQLRAKTLCVLHFAFCAFKE